MTRAGAERSVTPIAAGVLIAGLALTVGRRGLDPLAVVLLLLGGSAAGVALIRSALRRPRGRAARVLGTGVRSSRAGCACSGGVMLAGLALALASRPAATLGAELSLAGLAGSLVVAGPELVAAVRRVGPAVLRVGLILAGLALLAVIAVLALKALKDVWPIVVLVVITAGGLLLVIDALRADTGRRRRTAQGAAGALMVIWAGVLGILFAGTRASGNPWLVVLSSIGIVVAVIVMLATPLLLASRAERRRLELQRMRDADRQRISADLHDSVLQTLALVQRKATDAAAVARLARRQEHALRAWMAGESALSAESLSGAMHDVAAEVENATGLVIELSMIGDRPSRPGDAALLAAAREALRNVARHAPGRVANLFCEITEDGVDVSVLDEGPGFAPDQVPRARRGIRDSIIARMDGAGGSAEIKSRPGEGTEVRLRLPRS